MMPAPVSMFEGGMPYRFAEPDLPPTDSQASTAADRCRMSWLNRIRPRYRRFSKILLERQANNGLDREIRPRAARMLFTVSSRSVVVISSVQRTLRD
jgi:hypothetical protein